MSLKLFSSQVSGNHQLIIILNLKKNKVNVNFYFQLVFHQFIHGLDTCTIETLSKAAGKFMEMLVQEKIIDSYIESVKKDQLDENVLTEPLEKFILYFDAMKGIVFANENDKIHQSHCVKDSAQALSAACESLLTDCLSIQAMHSVKFVFFFI